MEDLQPAKSTTLKLTVPTSHPPAWLPPPLLPSLVGLVLLLRGWLELEVEGGMAPLPWTGGGGMVEPGCSILHWRIEQPEGLEECIPPGQSHINKLPLVSQLYQALGEG